MILILGAGLSGASCSYHLGHENCVVLEKSHRPGGHIAVDCRDGFVWDPGPHVSFTKNAYVRELFASSVEGGLHELDVTTVNYFEGHWVDHPAQTALYQVPEPLRSECLASLLAARESAPPTPRTSNYRQWLESSSGEVFTRTFAGPYTRKYWTRGPADMTTDWVGTRVLHPQVDDVIRGSRGPLGRKTHYITAARYPKKGGFQSFARTLFAGARIEFGAEAVSVDLKRRTVRTADGRLFTYSTLINTLPLPIFVGMCAHVPAVIQEAALTLSCSQLLLVNVIAPHPTRRPEHWIYVYDSDKLSTRINCTETLAAANAPAGWTGVQVEVYFSRHRPLEVSPTEVGPRVLAELIHMGLVDPSECEDPGNIDHHIRYSPWANVIFDHDTRPALDQIWTWLEQYGLEREPDDLSPLTDWERRVPSGSSLSRLVMAGRFGQWKYYWTDDCVLRGKMVGDFA